jgi:raffinose/stachyose/melibiose transport system substrate-binding protein
MRGKQVMALGLVAAMTVAMTGCGSSTPAASSAPASSAAASESSSAAASTAESAAASTTAAASDSMYANLELGKTYADVTANIKLLTHRTDMLADDYAGTTFKQYVAEFNKLYPNVKVDIEGVTDYANDSLTRLTSGDWGDIMMIPAVDKGDLSNYFLSYGDIDTMNEQINYASAWEYDGQVYGVPSTGNAQGIVYNKAVFTKAGITDLPKTPDDFIKDLQAIKDKTDAIPLYTNYAAGWTMGAWDAYIGGSATGDSKYMNQVLLHASNPFADPGDGTHAYNVYKILYDAVNQKLIEDDYTTTDWEGCKAMINSGKIGCMVLGSWSVSQMKAAGDHPDDIGYMPFPITVNGKQYASAGPDYSFGINKDSSKENQEASMAFVKFMTEKSGFSYNEAGLPIAKDQNDKLPDLYAAFKDVTLVADEPAVKGEEDLLNTLNSDSELMINSSDGTRVQAIVDHASKGDEKYDDIMKEWDDAWTKAQQDNDVTINK